MGKGKKNAAPFGEKKRTGGKGVGRVEETLGNPVGHSGGTQNAAPPLENDLKNLGAP